MKEGKINLGVLIVIIIVSLAGGTALGFVLNNIINPKIQTVEQSTPAQTQAQQTPVQQTQAQQPATTQNTTGDSVTEAKPNTPVVTLNYNEVKTLTANGKECKVGVVNSLDGTGYINSKIYVNDSFVKTYKYSKLEDKEFDASESRIDVNSVKGKDDTTYIIIIFKTVGSFYTDHYICIVNSLGEFVGSMRVLCDAEGIQTIDNSNGIRYIINEDSITVFKRFHAQNKNDIKYGAIKETITLSQNEIYTGYEKIYVEPDEATLAGK